MNILEGALVLKVIEFYAISKLSIAGSPTAKYFGRQKYL
jgi:hypothetical protein